MLEPEVEREQSKAAHSEHNRTSASLTHSIGDCLQRAKLASVLTWREKGVHGPPPQLRSNGQSMTSGEWAANFL